MVIDRLNGGFGLPSYWKFLPGMTPSCGGKFEFQASQAGSFSRNLEKLPAWLAWNSNFPPHEGVIPGRNPHKKTTQNPQLTHLRPSQSQNKVPTLPEIRFCILGPLNPAYAIFVTPTRSGCFRITLIPSIDTPWYVSNCFKLEQI